MAESIDIKALNEKVKQQSSTMMGLLSEVSRVIVGQRYILERMLVGILSDGHILLEGVPGLAKTLAVNSLAKAVSGDFKRIQFTPDLLPSDLTGTLIYDSKQCDFSVKKVRYFLILFWQMKLTERLQKSKALFLKQCRKDR